MNFQWFPFLHLFLITINLFLPNGSASPADEFYQTCGYQFSCGDTIAGIGYPFRGSDDPPYCGHPSLVLTCDHKKNVTNIEILGTRFRVLEIDETTQTMRIAREDILEGSICPKEMVNTTLDYSIFDYAASYANYTFFYGCPETNFPGFNNVSCGNGGGTVYVVPGNFGPGNCNASVTVPGPVPGNGAGGPFNGTVVSQDLQKGFLIRWKFGDKACSDCTATNGQCGYNFATNQTACFCPNQPYISATCPVANGTSLANAPLQLSPSPSPSPNAESGKYSGFKLTCHEICCALELCFPGF